MELREPIRTRSLVCHRRFGAYLHAQRLRLGLTVEDLSKESNFWWLPSQLDTIERGSTLLHPDEIVDLAELYRVGGKWPGSDEWQLSFDGSTRERITAHTDPGSRTVRQVARLGLVRGEFDRPGMRSSARRGGQSPPGRSASASRSGV